MVRLAVISWLVWWSGVARAAPLEFSHSGRILDATGAPLTGSHDVVFSVHDAATDGVEVWSEAQTLSLDDKGYYRVLLGQQTEFDTDAFGDQPLFLGIAIDGNPEMPGRQPLTAVPYTMYAITAVGVDGGTVDAKSVAVDHRPVVDQFGNVDANALTVGDVPVIDETGALVATIDWSRVDAPPGIGDTLDELSSVCLPNQRLTWDGALWVCKTRTLPPHTHLASEITGTVSVAQLPVGTGPGTVAAGDHAHDSRYYPEADLDARLYAKTAFDSLFYSKLECDTRYYTQTSANARYWSRNDADLRYYPRDEADLRFYSRAELDAAFATRTATDAAHYDRTTFDDRFLTAAEASVDHATKAVTDARFYSRAQADSRYYPRSTFDTTFAPRAELYSKTAMDAAFLAPGASPYVPRAELYTRAEVDALIASGGTPALPTLTERIQSASHLSRGWIYPQYRQLSDIALPFDATGGPVEVQFSTTAYAGGAAMHFTCRPMIDGITAGIYNRSDPTNYWEAGLKYLANGTWEMWDDKVVFTGIPEGRHLLTMECQTNDTHGADLGASASAIRTVSVIPYDPVDTAEVKAYSGDAPGGAGFSTGGTWKVIPGLSVPFEALGGPIKVDLDIPLYDGSSGHNSCRSLVDGVPAGAAQGDNTADYWQEGLFYLPGAHGVWERTRVFDTIAAGPHTLTVECHTDSGTLTDNGSSQTHHAAVVAYPPPTAADATVHAYGATAYGQQSATHTNWKTYTGLSLTFTSNGGPVELGISIPVGYGSHSTCRPLVDGAPVIAGEPDDPTAFWHNGLEYTSGSWEMWDRSRIYRGIPAGTHTMTLQCRTDSTSVHYMGTGGSANHIYAIAYDE